MRRPVVPALVALAALFTGACGSDAPPAESGPTTATPSPRPAEPSAEPFPTAAPTTDLPTTATDVPGPTEELRAVWLHLFDDTLKSAASVDAAFDRIASAGFNTVLVEVVRRHDAYYDSDVLPRSTDPALEEGFDLIEHGTAAAHARGLRFEAWIPTMPAYHGVYDDLPTPAGWVWADHGRDAPEDQRWVTRYADGRWDDHLDPGLPEVREHVAAIAREIASNYEVDGIHLDYVRYPEAGTGYHPRALQRFRDETGASGTPDHGDPAFSEWRREQVRLLVAGIRDAVAAVAPDLPLTAAVIAQSEGPHGERPFAATRGYVDYHQDWPSWLRDGLLDVAYPMTYFDAREHADWFEQWAAFQERLAAEVDARVVGGMAGYLNEPDASIGQMRRLLGATDGVALYSYQQTVDREPYDALLPLLPQRLWSQ